MTRQSQYSIPPNGDYKPHQMRRFKYHAGWWMLHAITAISILQMVIGALAMGFGAWLLANKHLRGYIWESSARIRILSNAQFTYVISSLIIGGSLLVLGCCGLCARTSKLRHLRFVYAALISIVLLMIFVAICVVVWQWMDTGNEIRGSLDYLVQKYYQGAGIIPEIVDQIQWQFKCCGNSGCVDYRAFYMDVPRSCDLSCEGCTRRIIIALRTTLTINAIIAAIMIASGIIAEIIVMLSWRHEDRQWHSFIEQEKQWHDRYGQGPPTTMSLLSGQPKPQWQLEQQNFRFKKSF